MKNFLVVDDDRSIRNLYNILIKRNYKSANVDFSPDGSDALALASRSHFDIIISDIDMPGMNGISFHEALKEHDSSKAEKVAIISGNVYGDHLRYIQEERICYMEKPFRPNQFYSFVDSILLQQEAALALDSKRRHERLEAIEGCLLETSLPHEKEKIKISAETLDYSEGGLGLAYKGKEIPSGTFVNVFIDRLNIFNRTARVVWTSVTGDLTFRAGLQWV